MDQYNHPFTSSLKEEELRDELARLRGTASFQFGNHFVQAFKQPWRIALLPLTTPLLIYRLLKAPKQGNTLRQLHHRDCVLVFSTDSPRGLHVDRGEALLASLSNATTQRVHVSTDNRMFEGTDEDTVRFIMPGRKQSPGMSPRVWNKQCETILNCLIDVYSPKTFVFDGDFPFRGLLNVIKLRDGMNRFWVRESPKNHNISQLPLDGFETFDAVLHPSLTKASDPDTNVGKSGSVFCNPIVGPLPSEEALRQRRLKLAPLTSQLIFCDLGSSRAHGEVVIDALLADDSVRLLLRPGTKNRRLLEHPRTVLAHGMNYIESIGCSDAAVLDPDQYSLHAALSTQTPTLSVLDESTTKSASSEHAFQKGLPIIHLDSTMDVALVKTAVHRLLDAAVQQQLREQMESLKLNYDQTPLVKFLMELQG